jgi:adenine-specific DNA-methyltransferase
MDKMRMESLNMTEKNIDKIAELFPNCITDPRPPRGGG